MQELARLGSLSRDDLRSSWERANEICQASGSDINAGLVISVIQRRRASRPPISRVGSLWQRGLHHLLITDDVFRKKDGRP